MIEVEQLSRGKGLEKWAKKHQKKFIGSISIILLIGIAAGFIIHYFVSHEKANKKQDENAAGTGENAAGTGENATGTNTDDDAEGDDA